MAAHHDNAPGGVFQGDHLLPTQQGLAGNVADGLDQRRSAADGEVPPLGHGAVQRHGKGLHVAVLHRVHNNLAEIVHRQQLGLDAVKV